MSSTPSPDRAHPSEQAPTSNLAPLPDQVGLPEEALPGAPDDDGWRRLHPITPLLRGWKVIAAVLVAFGHQSFQWFYELRDVPAMRISLLLAGIVVLLLITYVDPLTTWLPSLLKK